MSKNKKLNRREFIKLSSAATAAIPITLSGFPLFANDKPEKYQFKEDNENILVLVQLQGGNDGLNTIFDLNQYSNLQSVRSNIIVPEANLISLTDATKLHPNMGGMQRMWENETLGIIQNVGYPNQNRSHFRSTDIWNSASKANEFISTGWIGRFFQMSHPNFPTGFPNTENPDPFGITLGKVVSETCEGNSFNFSMALEDPENPGVAAVANTGSIPDDCYGNSLNFINDTVKQTNAYAASITKAHNAGNNLSTKYTETDLSEKLKNVARLISGGIKTKVFIVQIGGFDTHANQTIEGEPLTGIHSELLKEVSDAIEAFQDDLTLLGIHEKVFGMTYSEFGRRIRSNAGLGTDHGTAAPLFVFGNCAKKQILGDAPEIDTQVDVKEGVQMQYDFRNIYRTVLTDWLGATPSESMTVLLENFDALPIFKTNCNANLSVDDFDDSLNLNVYPNPTQDYININFSGNNERVTIKLFNSIGAVVKEITNTAYSFDSHTLKVDISNLAYGTYFIHYQNKGIIKTKKILKF